MADRSLSQRVEAIFDEYQSLFGDADHLKLSDDIAVAQSELEILQNKQKAVNTSHCVKDSETLSTAERFSAYQQFVQSEAAKHRKRKDLSDLMLLDASNTSDASNRTKSKLEILAEERDYKRRRQSYKGAKAATSKRSYTEVIRDVIETQSEMLRSMQAQEGKQIKKEPRH